ncbi:hypothetical protein LOD99_10273 [Oopsacas minuta]|uniref:Uncharacterized protein n=1 Tax=Oopsacas minuta TaxID=111878 RepID=A0AAV7KI27_9METZ|nr:hypothetical protein LOD99_10273 [Oopsacas minuta]
MSGMTVTKIPGSIIHLNGECRLQQKFSKKLAESRHSYLYHDADLNIVSQDGKVFEAAVLTDSYNAEAIPGRNLDAEILLLLDDLNPMEKEEEEEDQDQNQDHNLPGDVKGPDPQDHLVMMDTPPPLQDHPPEGLDLPKDPPDRPVYHLLGHLLLADLADLDLNPDREVLILEEADHPSDPIIVAEASPDAIIDGEIDPDLDPTPQDLTARDLEDPETLTTKTGQPMTLLYYAILAKRPPDIDDDEVSMFGSHQSSELRDEPLVYGPEEIPFLGAQPKTGALCVIFFYKGDGILLPLQL